LSWGQALALRREIFLALIIRASLLGMEWKLWSLLEEERFLFFEERNKGKKEKAREE